MQGIGCYPVEFRFTPAAFAFRRPEKLAVVTLGFKISEFESRIKVSMVFVDSVEIGQKCDTCAGYPGRLPDGFCVDAEIQSLLFKKSTVKVS